MEIKKIAISGLAGGVASFVVGNILYLNPAASSLYAASAGAYCSQPMEPFGGLVNWLIIMWAGGLASSVMLALLYSFAESSIQSRPAWKKGALFGFMFWLASGLPNAYNTWLLHSYPAPIILLEAFNGLAGLLVSGIVTAIVYDRLGQKSIQPTVAKPVHPGPVDSMQNPWKDK